MIKLDQGKPGPKPLQLVVNFHVVDLQHHHHKDLSYKVDGDNDDDGDQDLQMGHSFVGQACFFDGVISTLGYRLPGLGAVLGSIFVSCFLSLLNEIFYL